MLAQAAQVTLGVVDSRGVLLVSQAFNDGYTDRQLEHIMKDKKVPYVLGLQILGRRTDVRRPEVFQAKRCYRCSDQYFTLLWRVVSGV
jgi:hypothetical protein